MLYPCDVQDFVVTGVGSENASNAKIRVTGRLTNTKTGQTIPGGDFMGNKAIEFTLKVQGFTNAQCVDLARAIALQIMWTKAGL